MKSVTVKKCTAFTIQRKENWKNLFVTLSKKTHYFFMQKATLAVKKIGAYHENLPRILFKC